jgi:hypothetical protein
MLLIIHESIYVRMHEKKNLIDKVGVACWMKQKALTKKSIIVALKWTGGDSSYRYGWIDFFFFFFLAKGCGCA